MAFVNPKQDVYDIKLTSHGRKLLSSGEFKPEFYAFYDDDILYDAQYSTTGSSREHQNYIETRIKEETPYMKALYNFTRLDLKNRTNIHGWPQPPKTLVIPGPPFSQIVGKTQSHAGEIEFKPPTTVLDMTTPIYTPYKQDQEIGILKNYIMQEPLGTSQMSNRYAPAWDAQIYLGEFSDESRKASAKIKFIGTPSNGDTIKLIDAEKNTVIFIVATGVSTKDGSVDASGKVIFGINGISSAEDMAKRFTEVINNVTSYDQSANPGSDINYTLNITGYWSAKEGTDAVLIQDTAGVNGNTYIANGLTNTMKIDFGNGGIGAIGYLQNFKYPTVDIPQINVNAKCVTVAKFSEEFEKDPTQAISANNALSHMGEEQIIAFSDGTYLEIRNGEILIELGENNSLYQKENFDIEVFLVEDPDTNNEEWTSLYFNPEAEKTSESFYQPYVNKEEEIKKYVPPEPINRLDNFLEVYVDDEISKNILCRTRAKFDKKNLFTDLRINCNEQEVFIPKEATSGLYDVVTDDSEVIC